MKIPPELYGRIVEAIRAAVPRTAVIAHRQSLSTEARYQPGGKGNLAKRMRWDLFWAASNRHPIAKEVYALGCNDNHIDTVLRKAMVELDWPEFTTP